MPHLLHEMKSTRVPRRFVFFDTEALRDKKGAIERQRWRCGVTLETHWQSKEQRWSRPVTEEHREASTLWHAITGAARTDTRTVVVAHNLAYDLRIADAFNSLTRLGWTIDRLALSAHHVAFDVVRGRERLVFVDSTSVLPTSVEHLGSLLETPKPGLPEDDDRLEEWLHRCRVDTEILATAYLSVIDDLRSNDLGCWARSGAGIAWSTFLRHHCNRKVLVHDDDDLRAIEHGSIYGGRAEAWRHGRLRRTTWHEWDYELAYAHVLANETLPAYHLSRVTGLTMRHLRRTYPSTRWLVRAAVSSALPVLPFRDDHGTFFPVGDWEGWYWDCELIEAEACGAVIRPLEAHRYRGEDWLATWANWVIDRCATRDTPTDKVLALASKHWQRALVGRSAMRFGNWEERGDAWLQGVSYLPAHDLDSGQSGAIFQAGGRRWESWERTWWDSALPQLLSAVSAHCRVNLWQAMRTAGLDHIAYVDTDSVITDDEGSARLRQAVARGELGSLREKSRLSRLDVWAPRYVTSPTFTKIAGVASDRVETGEHTYTSSAWERLTEALAEGHPDEVVVRRIKAVVSLEDWHRVHLEGGQTSPYNVVSGERVLEGAQSA